MPILQGLKLTVIASSLEKTRTGIMRSEVPDGRVILTKLIYVSGGGGREDPRCVHWRRDSASVCG